MEKLVQFDRELFLTLNGWNNEAMDFLMYWVSDKFTWVPYYLLIAILIYKMFGRKTWLILPFAGLLIVFSDQSSVFFKNFFERLRPCHDESISDLVHTVKGHCGGKFSFVSSHATNTFALATFIGGVFKPQWKYFIYVMLFWAVLSSYSRIYLGVHYPADVFGGAVLGALIGTVMLLFYELLAKKIYKNSL
ncbi:MAG: phosphatase PAP2 family protein [Bacteroidia bacterium]|nr:phosphatase PAP2 family protein [Bacteroidia bacterium]